MGFTKQETFDLVFTHLFEQGEQAVVMNTTSCKYRIGTKMCAVGCLIPDNLYTQDLEPHTPWPGDSQDNKMNEILNDLGHDIELCRDLQRAHDNADWHSGFGMQPVLAKLRSVAKQHDLRF